MCITQETAFTDSGTTETTSVLGLKRKVKRDKLAALYRHLNVTTDPDLANIDRFLLKKNKKQDFF